MWNNCLIWAHIRYRSLYREWLAAGSPQDRVPCILRRPSRLVPTFIGHWLVGWWNPETGSVTDIESFTPDDTKPLALWQLWKVAIFKGHIKRGDARGKQ